MISVLTGRKVSSPMCKVTKARPMPRWRRLKSKSGVKCSPAVERGDRSLDAAVNSLVALRVVQRLVDVGRQGHLTDFVQPFVNRPAKGDRPAASRQLRLDGRHDRRLHRSRCFECHAHARPQPFSADQAFPSALRQRVQQENLDLGTAGLAAMEPRRNNPAVVGHQQVARPEIVAHVAKDAMLDLAGVAVHHQQPRGSPAARSASVRCVLGGGGSRSRRFSWG